MEQKFVFSTRDTTRYRFPTHVNDLVIDRAQAEASEVFVVVLELGQATPMHVHDDTEQIFFVLSGLGVLEVGESPENYAMNPGDIVRIPSHTLHRITCTGASPLRYLAVDCFVGGKPRDEPTWESHVRVVCEKNGWDFDKVKE